MLLIGPTASGKTPLGDILRRRGLWGRRCLHFDFGGELRGVGGADNRPLTEQEAGAVRQSLETGALLTDEQFPIARKLLLSFLADRPAAAGDLVVLNGLPRHAGQAAGIDEFVRVVAVVNLRCTGEVVRERIRTNAGGDRSGRGDDTPQAVARRLATFARRTAPLLAHYRSKGAAVIDVDVQGGTTAEDLWRLLDEQKIA